MFGKLKSVRKIENIACETLSEVLGLRTRGGYSKKENGNVPFKLEEAKIIADYFKMTIEELFFDGEVDPSIQQKEAM